MRFLVVDDSKAMRLIVTRTLRQAGYGGHDIVEASNGQEALELMQEAEPDLVLSDWNMPEMSGLDFLIRVRAVGNTVPFGFVTSESSADMRNKAAEAGAQFLIAKPFTADDFQDALELVGV